METAKFEVVVQLEIIPSKATGKSTVISTSFALDVSKNVVKSYYLDENDDPTLEGSKAITNALIQALIGNIHAAHQEGFRKDHEHLRYIIDQLQQGFATNVEVKKTDFKPLKNDTDL